MAGKGGAGRKRMTIFRESSSSEILKGNLFYLYDVTMLTMHFLSLFFATLYIPLP